MFKSHLSPHIPAIKVYNPLNPNVWCLNPIEIPCIPIPVAKNHQWNPIKSHKITIKSPLNPSKSPLNPIETWSHPLTSTGRVVFPRDGKLAFLEETAGKALEAQQAAEAGMAMSSAAMMFFGDINGFNGILMGY